MDGVHNLKQSEDRKVFLLEYLKPLVDVSSGESMQSLLREVIGYALEELCIQEQTGDKKLVENIKAYIEVHYMDTTLNISSIADSLGRNPKYIARVFRSEMQEGILDYINRLRIGKAIVLLYSHKYSVQEISTRVGYTNYKSFRRAFTNTMGVTPGKYRAQQQADSKGIPL